MIRSCQQDIPWAAGTTHLHIDGSKGTVSDGATQGTSKSKARVEINALRLLCGGGLGHGCRSGSHRGDGWKWRVSQTEEVAMQGKGKRAEENLK